MNDRYCARSAVVPGRGGRSSGGHGHYDLTSMGVRELFDLSGRTAIVTGGGSGIGRQMAGALAELGADIVICARKLERCDKAAAELAELGVRTLAAAL